MARLEGHFQEYPRDPQICLDNAHKLEADEIDSKLEKISIQEWLERMNFFKLTHKFTEYDVYTIMDLRPLIEN